MIDFIWDKDVSVSFHRRAARLGLVVFSWLVVCGVAASIVIPLAKPSLRKVATDGNWPVLAAVGPKTPPAHAAVVKVPPKITNGIELLRDADAPSTAPAVVWMTVTAYCPCPICCGKGANGVTASGKKVTAFGGHFAAAPAGIPFGTRLMVPGYDGGRAIPVIDRGGAIKGDCLDVFFPDHETARKWGRQRLAVTILPPPVAHDLVMAVTR